MNKTTIPVRYLEGVKEPHKAQIFKNFESEVKVVDDVKRTLLVRISTSSPDRSKDTVQPAGMVYDNFIKNPVILFAHKYDTKPIAKCTSLKVDAKGVSASVEFTPEGLYQEADIIYQMYKGGFLNAWSIGFMPLDYEDNEFGGYDFKKWEIFEFSSVPVPDNPEALTIMRSKGINVDLVLENKGVISFKETPKAPEGEAWDAGEEIKAATVEDLKTMCTWYDSENPDVKGAYKLPHHKAAGDHAVVWKGVAAAMGALLGARGGVDIPEGDRKGVYNHLKKSYDLFDKEAPEFKAYTEEELKALFPDLYEQKTADAEEVKQSLDQANEAIKTLQAETEALKKQFEAKATEDTPVSSLTAKQLKELFTPTATEQKDVSQVTSLAYVLSELQWLAYCFEYDEVSQDTRDKLNQAIAILLDAIKDQAELGKKSFAIADKDLTALSPEERAKVLAWSIEKAGRTISARHEEMLKAACDHMEKAAEQVNTVLGSVAAQGDAGDDASDQGKQAGDDLLGKIANQLRANLRQKEAILRNQKEQKPVLDSTLSYLQQLSSEIGGDK